MVSFAERLRQAKAEFAQRDADPLLATVTEAVRGFESLSTVALLTMLGLPVSTANGRRIAPLMRRLGFVGIKSRKLPPGGAADSLCRGWARTPAFKQRGKVEPFPDSQKEPCHV